MTCKIINISWFSKCSLYIKNDIFSLKDLWFIMLYRFKLFHSTQKFGTLGWETVLKLENLVLLS